MYDLYFDQHNDVVSLRKLFRDYRSIVYCLSTGGGKTVVAGHIAQLMRAKGTKILILVHRRELVKQFYETLEEAGLNRDVGIVCSGYTPTPWAPVQLAMVMSWARRKPPFRPNVIIIDEAHHVRAKSWHDVLDMYPKARVLGLTATPVRLDGKALRPPFQAIHCGLPINKLIELGRLAPVRVRRVPAGFVAKKTSSFTRDYNKRELDRQIDAKIVARATSAYLKYIPGHRTLFFAVNKRHAQQVANDMQEHGIRAAYVGDETEMHLRDEIFANFSQGHIDVVCNVSLVDEGFDVPACTAVMDGRPTMSVTKYLQALGRALRFQEGKIAEYIDLVGNTYRHGLPDIERNWSLDGDEIGKPVNKNDAGTNLRVCKECLTMFHKKNLTCPQCGTNAPVGKEVHEVDVELQEVLDSMPKPKGPPKPPKQAKMTVKQRASVLHEARMLVWEQKQYEAWLLLQQVGRDNRYNPLWAHNMADLIGITEQQRKKP